MLMGLLLDLIQFAWHLLCDEIQLRFRRLFA